MDDPVIMSREVRESYNEETKIIPTNIEQKKQHLLPFHVTNKELKEIMY